MIETVVVWRGSPSDLATDVFDLLRSEADREAFLDALANKIGCSKTALHDQIIREKEQVIEKLTAELDAHRSIKDRKGEQKHDSKCSSQDPSCFNQAGCDCKKTPADRLADVAEEVLGRYRIERGSLIQNAIDEYRSTRNGIGQTTAATFGSPPDPILVARHLLDCLTGGALASLICMVRDAITREAKKPSTHSWLKTADLANLTAHLRALGEKVE